MFRNRARHLVELLSWRGGEQSARTAMTFLADDGTSETTWTYGELDARARAVAVALLDVARPGDRALLLCPPGADFAAAIIGSLYAAVVPVPAYPPGNARQIGRIDVILRDAETDLIVTTAKTRDRIARWLDAEGRGGRFRFLCIDDVPADDAALWRMPDIDGNSLAFLQYTSGSTSEPKGVMVGHGNLMANLAMIEQIMGLTPEIVLVSWLPVFHDMGLIGNVFEPLYLGGRTTLMSPQAFVQEPVRWLQQITRQRATVTGAPNFGYALCVQSATDEQKESLDLSSLNVCYCGSEPIDSRVMDAFCDAFAPVGLKRSAFYACYGMAEATLLAAGSKHGGGSRKLDVGNRTLVGCGYSALGQELRVVDPDTRRVLGDDAVGEIWLRGPNVAQGYWRNPELTQELFRATLESGDGPFLRTGDLGFINEGNVFVTGRRKDVIIIRGRNYYPQDLERTAVESHAGLNPAGSAAFSIAPNGREEVVVVCEVKRAAAKDLDGDAVANAIRGAVLAEHELPLAAIVLIKPATLPKTSSGKVRRSATRDAFLDGSLESLYVGRASARPDKAGDVIAWLRSYAESRIDSRLIDERRTLPPYLVLDFGNRGLLGLQAPEDAGGLALSHRDVFRILEQLAAIDTTIGSFVGVHNALGLRPLLRHASAAQREAMLANVAQGRELASFAFTEPAAGSNPTAIESTATPDGRGGWTLRGTKKWIGTAAWAGVLHVFAHVVDESGARRGITCFTIRQDAPGLVQGPEELTMGMRGMVQNTVHLNDVPVSPDDVLGDVGQGMVIAQDIMEFGRICIAASSVGVMKRAAQLMARYAKRRSIATGRLLDNVVSRERLTRIVNETAALETLVDAFAGWLDAGVDVPKECYAAVKVLAAEAAYRAVDALMQILGGRGFIETNLVPQMLRDVRLMRIFEGPSETMQMFVGTRVAAASEPFFAFLRKLGGGDVADRLAALASEQPPTMLLGEAATWGFWLAVSGQPWLRERFEESLAEARREREAILGSDELEAIVARYAERIGDLEQYRPGVLEELDPLLKRGVAESRGREVARLPIAKPATPRPRNLETWMQGWIAQRLGHDAAAIDVTRPFAELGLDSITAVELTHQLKKAHGVDVAPTATWDFPNIRALAEHLTAEIAPRPSVSGIQEGGQAVIAADALDRMSEGELAALLASELSS